MYLEIIITIFTFLIGAKTFIEKGFFKSKDKPFVKRFNALDKIIVFASLFVFTLTISRIIQNTQTSREEHERNINIKSGIDTIKVHAQKSIQLLDTTNLKLVESKKTLDSIQSKTMEVLNERNKLLDEFEDVNSQFKKLIENDKLTIEESSPRIEILDAVSWDFNNPSFPIGIKVIFSNTGQRAAVNFTYEADYYELDSLLRIINKEKSFDSYGSKTIISPVSVTNKKMQFEICRFSGEKNNIDRIPYGAILKIKYKYLDEITDEVKTGKEYFYWTKEQNQKEIWRDAPDFIIDFIKE